MIGFQVTVENVGDAFLFLRHIVVALWLYDSSLFFAIKYVWTKTCNNYVQELTVYCYCSSVH